MPKITPRLIAAGRSSRGGWNRKQLELLGVEWPPSRGWQDHVIGQSISADTAAAFKKLRDAHIRRERQRAKRRRRLDSKLERKARGLYRSEHADALRDTEVRYRAGKDMP